MEEKLKTEKKKTRFIPVIIALIIAVAAIVIVCVIVANGTSAKVNRLHKTAEKYLSEMNYEQAIATYLDIIEIDPKNVKAYIELAEIYVEVDRVADAFEILNAGYEATEDEEIKEALDALTAAHTITDASAGDDSGNEYEKDRIDDNYQILYLDDEEAYDKWYMEFTALYAQLRTGSWFFNSYDKYNELYAPVLEYVNNGHDIEKKKQIVSIMTVFYSYYYNVFADEYVDYRKLYCELDGSAAQYNVDYESDEIIVLYDDDGYLECLSDGIVTSYYEDKKLVREVINEEDYVEYINYFYDEFSCLIRDEHKYVYQDGSVNEFAFTYEYDRENNIMYRRLYETNSELYDTPIGDVWIGYHDEYGRITEIRDYIYDNKIYYFTYSYDTEHKEWKHEVVSE